MGWLSCLRMAAILQQASLATAACGSYGRLLMPSEVVSR